MSLSKRSDWLTSNTIKLKQGAAEDHHYINHQSFPRLPSSSICAHHLIAFVCSQTNTSVNITIMSLQFKPAQRVKNKSRQRQREDVCFQNDAAQVRSTIKYNPTAGTQTHHKAHAYFCTHYTQVLVAKSLGSLMVYPAYVFIALEGTWRVKRLKKH